MLFYFNWEINGLIKIIGGNLGYYWFLKIAFFHYFWTEARREKWHFLMFKTGVLTKTATLPLLW